MKRNGCGARALGAMSLPTIAEKRDSPDAVLTRLESMPNKSAEPELLAELGLGPCHMHGKVNHDTYIRNVRGGLQGLFEVGKALDCSVYVIWGERGRHQ